MRRLAVLFIITFMHCLPVAAKQVTSCPATYTSSSPCGKGCYAFFSSCQLCQKGEFNDTDNATTCTSCESKKAPDDNRTSFITEYNGADDPTDCYAVCTETTHINNIQKCTPRQGTIQYSETDGYKPCECDPTDTDTGIECVDGYGVNPVLNASTDQDKICVKYVQCIDLLLEAGNSTINPQLINEIATWKSDSKSWNYSNCKYTITEMYASINGNREVVFTYNADTKRYERTSATLTSCEAGYTFGTYNNGDCGANTDCVCTKTGAGWYSPSATTTLPCPMGTTSDAGATDITDCYLSDQTIFKDIVGEFHLPAGTKIPISKKE